jgi:hypothetical protein
MNNKELEMVERFKILRDALEPSPGMLESKVEQYENSKYV